ncbi:MAG TPA: NUDIX domain-containing protein [Candidatus Saccharimonadales bacterium]|nr:NUDIX domain-containing protein [Candidatus Saccharimonadales bacterium]
MHHIQKKILSLLLHTPSLGYAQMRPKGVESNHFAYHLEQLVRTGLVEKNDRQYSLTSEGLALADRVSHESMTVRKQPHIVTTIQVTNDEGKMAVFHHTFQPYLDKIGFPQGRLHYEETIAEAAARELAEKTGLQNVPLTHRGIAYIHATKDGVDISKVLAHVFTGTVSGAPKLVSADKKKGKSLWEMPGAHEVNDYMPGFHEIRELLASYPSTELFFIEVETTM